MGTIIAPVYANQFMDLENKLLETHDWEREVWWRFIDDLESGSRRTGKVAATPEQFP